MKALSITALVFYATLVFAQYPYNASYRERENLRLNGVRTEKMTFSLLTVEGESYAEYPPSITEFDKNGNVVADSLMYDDKGQLIKVLGCRKLPCSYPDNRSVEHYYEEDRYTGWCAFNLDSTLAESYVNAYDSLGRLSKFITCWRHAWNGSSKEPDFRDFTCDTVLVKYTGDTVTYYSSLGTPPMVYLERYKEGLLTEYIYYDTEVEVFQKWIFEYDKRGNLIAEFSYGKNSMEPLYKTLHFYDRRNLKTKTELYSYGPKPSAIYRYEYVTE